VENEPAKARESLVAAESELQRIEQLVKQGLRSQQDVEQARVRAQHAREDLTAAQDKRKLFGGGEEAKLAPVRIAAPREGKVLTALVNPGQYVPAAAPLLSVADLSRLWVRVPIPEHYLAQMDRGRPVHITVKGPDGDPKATAPSFEGKPLVLVPQVDAARHTADMLYELVLPAERPFLAKDQ